MTGRGLAASAFLALAAPGCCSCAATPAFTVRKGPAVRPGPPPALSPRGARALHFGDFGDRTCQLRLPA